MDYTGKALAGTYIKIFVGTLLSSYVVQLRPTPPLAHNLCLNTTRNAYTAVNEWLQPSAIVTNTGVVIENTKNNNI